VSRRLLYRARQLLLGFRASLDPAETVLAQRLLSERELVLFSSMQARDQRHSMDMLRWLRARATPSPDLEAAALLHDVGKRGLRAWDRVAYVLLAALSVRLLDAAASERGPGPRRALWVLRHHAELGARLLEGAGARSRVVELVRRHKDALPPAPGGDEELRLLIEADGAC
jgi:hypothetical protein